MTNIQKPRGTRDILPEQQIIWDQVKALAAASAEQFGFLPITTPTYEEIGLFERSIGAGTDVMDKELFLVRGKAGEEQYALRPEGTAGIVRAFIENGLRTRPQPIKLWSFVNNFRYDRPQKGRYREHVQWDLELFSEADPFFDAWVIWTTWDFLTNKCGLQNVELQLNTLGTAQERETYQQALITFLQDRNDQLSSDSQERLTRNPLRVLDSKDPRDQHALEGAPVLLDSLGDASRNHFESIQHYLTSWKIPFVHNHRLVRGLDYYCHTAFEWTVAGAGGQQSSLGGGGRYDGLITQLGGQPIGAVGAGIGLDRVIEECERQGITFPPTAGDRVAVIAAEASDQPAASTLIKTLSSAGNAVFADFTKTGIGNQLKQADRHGATTAYIVGQAETERGVVTRKDLRTGEQEEVTLSSLS